MPETAPTSPGWSTDEVLPSSGTVAAYIRDDRRFTTPVVATLRQNGRNGTNRMVAGIYDKAGLLVPVDVCPMGGQLEYVGPAPTPNPSH